MALTGTAVIPMAKPTNNAVITEFPRWIITNVPNTKGITKVKIDNNMDLILIFLSRMFLIEVLLETW